jgi:hypothetical protein
MPPVPIVAENEDGGWKNLQASRRGDLYVIENTPQTVDHKGHVIWADDFEDTLNHWEVTLVTEGSTAALSSDSAHRGAKALKVVSAATIGAGAKFFPEIQSGKVGVELRFALPEGGLAAKIAMQLKDGSNVYTWGFGYHAGTTPELQAYGGSVGDWFEGVVKTLSHNGVAYHVLKLVVDLTAHTYIRARCDAVEYDMAAWATLSAANTDPAGLTVEVDLEATGNAAQTGYVDDLIVTGQEPANSGTLVTFPLGEEPLHG